MDIARHIALVDELCHRPFPAEHGPSDGVTGAPGHFTAVLESSHGLRTGDPGERAETVDQYEKTRDALFERLAPRWGETLPWNLQTVLLRTEREEIPEPWAGLSARARVAYVWEVRGTGRWVAVAVADRDETDEVQLLAVIARNAPP
ncbi:hypothetical protein ACFY1G_25310 [Streptomyces olivaceus]|uniref:Uncharacterized protein n=1 Tax=Streptomyces olivaceus TaxID=47716 RepID=A0ABS7WD47_STROV|nr:MULTISPECIES: hypothetical protein [Streptomyces]AOW85849.1 hypothetical protein BC342_04160 [Streptomyces olivaceus]MBZ6092251.1 hypothetical protein [Streptomyces olivaceus]MBZ6099239.1 hypothetical protein [Streptomyces olivaceus]MBZ6120237.1 hypothetical protein [Streptomyces olivaceus]MBZ6155215.1 hypothetical protein [Streptomyces olivaceus]